MVKLIFSYQDKSHMKEEQNYWKITESQTCNTWQADANNICMVENN